MSLIGKILWWDKRDQEGIIIDEFGNEYYFNYSVIDKTIIPRLKDCRYVNFEVSKVVPYVSCAKNVKLVTEKKSRHFEALNKFIDEINKN